MRIIALYQMSHGWWAHQVNRVTQYFHCIRTKIPRERLNLKLLLFVGGGFAHIIFQIIESACEKSSPMRNVSSYHLVLSNIVMFSYAYLYRFARIDVKRFTTIFGLVT